MESINRKDAPFASRPFLSGKVSAGRVYPEFFPFMATDAVINIGCGMGPQAVVYRNTYSRMIGIDINEERLRSSASVLAAEYGVRNYETLCADVEKIPLPDESFEKALAIDIIEHVRNPHCMLLEARRLLKPGGLLLVTFPAMHDKYTRFTGMFSRRRASPSLTWNPDAHNQDFPVREWITIVEKAGFSFVRSRATTMFPPLHLYGVPRFWFSNGIIHTIDRFFCSLPLCKNFGQTLMCVFRK